MDELDDIFTRGNTLDAKLLTDLIKPYLVIDLDDDNRVVLNEAGYELTAENQILLYLLSRKALLKKGLIDEEGITPATIISLSGLKGGTVHPALKSLRTKGLVTTRNSLYIIPNHQLYKLKKRLLKEGEAKDGR